MSQEQLKLYHAIFRNLSDLALSDALLEGDACLTLCKIQQHIVRCATVDGFREFYNDNNNCNDAKTIEEVCISIARMLYVNPVWLYNGQEADTKGNKQKITDVIRKCIVSSQQHGGKAETVHDDADSDDGDGDKVEIDEEDGGEEEDGEEDLECTEAPDEESNHGEEFEHEEATETNEGESEEYELLDDATDGENGEEEGIGGNQTDEDEEDEEEDEETQETSSDASLSISNGTTNDELSLNDQHHSYSAPGSDSDVEWVDDMDDDEVLRIDRCYMNIDNDLINDFDFFK